MNQRGRRTNGRKGYMRGKGIIKYETDDEEEVESRGRKDRKRRKGGQEREVKAGK